MKKSIHISLLLLVITVVTGCTHNDGDIGQWFGTWQLEEITADGTPEPGYGHDIFWQFQSTVFCMRKVTVQHDIYPRWGTWQDEGGATLLLDFTHSDNKNPEGGTIYTPFPETHIKPDAVTDLKIVEMSRTRVHLQYTGDDGTIYRYSLKKWQ